MAMTFIEIAVSPDGAERTAWCRGEARKAYDTVLRMMNRVDVSRATYGFFHRPMARICQSFLYNGLMENRRQAEILAFQITWHDLALFPRESRR